ncbi:Uncharacterised protein [Mycobacteroides abscessus subsp. bolletii]|nr:Uncharacterised protein [Mycobacteroides abscessus subsp. abscessus]SHX99363.1 Uncharacterised protein [Mycobacteroides abscessus subsp. bolletii]SIE32098.1 Uncharacterised protein [Mycobacteroides abscessus subsp. abscessus]SIK98394.1 Uncharacterised protein [Mycobacteroides abscessus subsp. abscessus]SKF63750.1 Uncharacterised protein [Mycobacteroides abscessus subsp. bolletii]
MFIASPIGRRGTKIQSAPTSGPAKSRFAYIPAGELASDRTDQRRDAERERALAE